MEVKTYTVSLDNPDYKGGTGLKAFRPSPTAPKNIPMFIQAQVVLKSDFDSAVKKLQEELAATKKTDAMNFGRFIKANLEKDNLKETVKALEQKLDDYEKALEYVCRVTYGTEICNTAEENNEILARHFFNSQEKARSVLEKWKAKI